jgi:hypothetical protein
MHAASTISLYLSIRVEGNAIQRLNVASSPCLTTRIAFAKPPRWLPLTQLCSTWASRPAARTTGGYSSHARHRGIPPPAGRRRTSLPHLKRRGAEITAESIAACLPATAADVCKRLSVPSSKYYCGRVSLVAREGGLQLLRPPRRDTGTRRPRIPAEKIFHEGSGASQSLLRRRLVADGFAEYKCSTPSCPVVDEWLDAPITLQLDHVNGDPTDNRVKNLRFLCPNCHAQTPTYVRGKGRRPRTLATAA